MLLIIHKTKKRQSFQIFTASYTSTKDIALID